MQPANSAAATSATPRVIGFMVFSRRDKLRPDALTAGRGSGMTGVTSRYAGFTSGKVPLAAAGRVAMLPHLPYE